MDSKKIGAGILGTTALVFGGVDASKLDEQPIERIETVAGYTVEAKQIENRVETSFPWKDQPAIKVVYDMGEPTLAEKFKDKRKKEVVTEVVDFGEGGFKVDILLDEKPETNTFCYAIQGAENYDFFYQSPLTEQEIAEGASRPPEIDGSYAVYHKTLKNYQIGKENYATGKVMHIPRPQVWSMSDVETKVWADMNYDNGNLCVTVPQDFLDKAEYPVRVDPTFGYTSVGASNLSVTTNVRLQSTVGTSTASGTVTSVSYFGYANSGTETAKGALYLRSDKSRIAAASATTTISTTQKWWDLDVVDTAITPGAYHIAFAFTSTARFVYDTGTGVEGAGNSFTLSVYNDFPQSTLQPSNTNVRASTYITYEPDGASVKLPATVASDASAGGACAWSNPSNATCPGPATNAHCRRR